MSRTGCERPPIRDPAYVIFALGGSAARPTENAPTHENTSAESTRDVSFDRMVGSLLWNQPGSPVRRSAGEQTRQDAVKRATQTASMIEQKLATIKSAQKMSSRAWGWSLLAG